MDFVDKPLVPIVPAFTRQAPTHIYVPIAAPGNPGLAEYNPKDFDVSDGKVQLSRDVRQLLAGFDIGMQVAIKYALAWANGKKYTTSTTLPSDNFVEPRFMAAVEYELGTYTFTKNEDGWWLNGYIVNLNTYGITPINDNPITIELSIIDDPETDISIAPWYHNNAEYWAHHPDPIDTDDIVDEAVTKIKLAAGLANSIDSAAHDIIITRNAITQTVTVSLKNESGSTIATSSAVIPGSDIDTSVFASGIVGELSADSGLRVLTVAIKNADGNVIGYVDIPFPIPSEADENNPLATRGFVNSSIQTNRSNFRGNWENWDDIPESSEGYPEDYDGSTVPTINDYLTLKYAETYPDQPSEGIDGWWMFKYTGDWETNGKNGWLPEYPVNRTPFTDAQLNAINSGITAQIVGSIAGKLDKVTTPAENTRVYSIGQNGSQSVIDTGYSPVTGDIARWDTGGKLRTGTATEDNHAVQKKQFDEALAGKSAVKVNGSVVGQWDADTKLDKRPSTEKQIVYSRTSGGVDSAITYSAYELGNTIMCRDARGTARVNGPTQPEDIANKKYVDDNLPKIIRI